MKVIALFSFCSATCFAFLLKHPPLPEYGKSGPDTIAVSVYGAGVKQAGVYHMKKGTLLAHAILAAGCPPPDDKCFIELYNSFARSPYHREVAFDRTKKPVVEDIVLLDRDEIGFSQKELNQPSEPMR